MIELNVKTIAGIVAAGVGVAVAGWLVYDAVKVPDCDIQPMKDSVVNRFKHASDLKLNKDIKEENFERIRGNLIKEIKALYPEKYHSELLAYVDEQWTLYFNL